MANPFGVGDNLDLRLQLTSASRTVFGRASYEMPVGGVGTRLGIGFSSLAYSLGAPFTELGAEGFARVFDASVLHPIRRTRTSTLLGTLQLQRKWVEDRYESVGFTAPRDITNLVGGVAWEHRDAWLGGGYVNAGATLTAGNVSIGSQEARDLDSGTGGRSVEGSFTKLNYTLSRLQALGGSWTLFGSLGGQLASKNLDNAERMGLGGPRAVRAYSTGSLVADEGTIATAELRYSVNPEVTLSVFYDSGWGKVNRDPIQSVLDNNIRIGGYGLGFFWGKPRNFQVQGSVAWRDTDPIPGDTTDKTPRVYVQGVKFF
jgi:hemolysin activation/secretion protein